MNPTETFETRAQRLRQATSLLGPSAGFRDRVLERVLSEPFAWWHGVTPLARRTLPALALMAVLAVAAAFQVATVVDETLASAYGSAEVDW